jgi:hypothetical protein
VIIDKLRCDFKNELKAAGIPEQDEQGHYATFHSVWQSANTFLGVANAPTRLRMPFMRHADIPLKKQRYDAFARLKLP